MYSQHEKRDKSEQRALIKKNNIGQMYEKTIGNQSALTRLEEANRIETAQAPMQLISPFWKVISSTKGITPQVRSMLMVWHNNLSQQNRDELTKDQVQDMIQQIQNNENKFRKYNAVPTAPMSPPLYGQDDSDMEEPKQPEIDKVTVPNMESSSHFKIRPTKPRRQKTQTTIPNPKIYHFLDQQEEFPPMPTAKSVSSKKLKPPPKRVPKYMREEVTAEIPKPEPPKETEVSQEDMLYEINKHSIVIIVGENCKIGLDALRANIVTENNQSSISSKYSDAEYVFYLTRHVGHALVKGSKKGAGSQHEPIAINASGRGRIIQEIYEKICPGGQK